MSLIVSFCSLVVAAIAAKVAVSSMKKVHASYDETRTVLKQLEAKELELQSLAIQIEQLSKKLVNLESTKTPVVKFYDELKTQQNLKIFNLHGFITLVGQGCIEFASDDMKDKFNSLVNCHHRNFWASDKSISPLGRSHFYIMIYYHSDKVAGYQMFFTSPDKTCTLFEVYVAESLRNLAIASSLIESTIGFCDTQLKIRKFDTHLLKQENGQRSLLVNVFEQLKKLHPKANFKVTVEEPDI
ncbi:hypothetical protein NL53_20675 [Vibrio variabilis]|uniref:N-acetyltransferase domain-containing protein n=1 Tax=Vibrio variabilis TaxID=990271 RepID=A0ABR4Y6K9_9VIBR|nr:GNAT family N-acetyltransferase [Vibrio variabilis]KHA58657.1 hypothetical protein NL53_20675 [Vibrio variabilis]